MEGLLVGLLEGLLEGHFEVLFEGLREHEFLSTNTNVVRDTACQEAHRDGEKGSAYLEFSIFKMGSLDLDLESSCLSNFALLF